MDTTGGVDKGKRYVGIFYVFAAIVVGKALESLVALVLSRLRVNDFTILVEGWTLSTLIGFAVAAAAAVVIWRIPRINTASMEVALELRRTTWPSLRETRAATVAVMVASLIASIILGVFDYIWGHLSSLVY
jgi:preprotein translocase subunit SecE